MKRRSLRPRSAYFLPFVLMVVLLVATAGCGGVSSRIKKHEREFLSYPPETQAQIQSGRIDRGFTPDMVYIAKGEPASKETITRDGRKIEVWRYARPASTSPAAGTPSANLSTPYGYPGFGPGPSQPTPLFYERSYFKVEFENGVVARWDHDMQDDPGLSDVKLPAVPYDVR